MSNTFNSAFSAMNPAQHITNVYGSTPIMNGYPGQVRYFHHPPPSFPVYYPFVPRPFYAPMYNPAQHIPPTPLTQHVPQMRSMQPMQPMQQMQQMQKMRQSTGQKFIPMSDSAKREDILRPFAYASMHAFTYLHDKIMQTVKHMRDKDHITVRGVDSKDMFEFTSTDGRPQKWALHTMMYGKMTGPDFTVRENTHEKYGIISPFIAMQHVLLKKNLFLTNESDPEKGHMIVLVIRRIPPDASIIPLWHGQNVMPTGQDDEIILTNFYHASFSDAAIFVNQRVETISAAGNTEETGEDFVAVEVTE